MERRADATGHSFASMMELAGRSVAEVILHRYYSTDNLVTQRDKETDQQSPRHPVTPSPCLLLIGPGNNGGDGLVCARYLHQAGVPVRVYLWKRRTDPQNDYEQHFARLTALNIATCHATNDPDFKQLQSWLEECAIIVDSLLGTGSNRAIEGELAAILDKVTEDSALRLPNIP